MDYWLLTAAGLSSLWLLALVTGGGKDVHTPMLTSEMSGEHKAHASILWHAVTVVLWIGSTVLLWAGTGHGVGMALWS